MLFAISKRASMNVSPSLCARMRPSRPARPFLSKNRVELFIDTNFGLDYFNSLLEEFLKRRLSPNQYIVVKLLEVSQFIRMTPFKKEIDEDKMIFFYALASKLFEDLDFI